MIRTPRTLARRLAFTLIELLVVIAIIAILVALTTAGVMRFFVKGPEAQAANDISQLDISIQNFKRDFKVEYVPSKIILCEKYGDYGATQLDIDSKNYLTSLFPQLLTTWQSTGIDWNGDGKIATGAATAVTLEGDQCLVFFLGGIPTAGGGVSGCLGFSTNPRNPAAAGGTRKGPYFEFPSARLLDRSGKGFYSFLDAFSAGNGKNRPYAYFSNYGRRDGYNPYTNASNQPVSDCAGLGVAPYYMATSPAVRYHNPTGYQIICAGNDGVFGPGGLWTPATAAQIPQAGQDDLCNFNNGYRLSAGG